MEWSFMFIFNSILLGIGLATHIKYDGLGFIPLDKLMSGETA